METLNSFALIVFCFGLLAGIKTPQASENADIPLARIEHLENKFQELEHLVKSLEQSLHQTRQVESVQRSDIPTNNYNNARRLELSYQKRSDIPNPQVPPEESDPELQTFEHQLTPEQQQLIKKMNGKLKYLQAVLHEPQHQPDPNEMEPVQNGKNSVFPEGAAIQFSANNHKRSDLPEPKVPGENEDTELQTFEHNLTPEQQELLKKMKNKVKYLQAVLHEPEPEPNPNEVSSDKGQVMEKKSAADDKVRPSPEEDKALSDYMANLSPEQQGLIKKNKKKLQYLKAVLNEPQKSPNPSDVEEVIEAKKELIEEEDEEKGAVTFTAADRRLLQEVNKKLNELKKSLETFKRIYFEKQHSLGMENEESKDKNEHGTEADGEFGQFVQVRRKRGRESEWHDTPVSENNLGLVDKKCKDCECGNKQCDCDACDISVSDKISKRLVTGVRSGATAGVNLKQLLSVLSQVRDSAYE